jgi:hypothetical protein
LQTVSGTMLAMGEEHMATSAERIRVLRERQGSGFRRLTIDVSDDDLRDCETRLRRRRARL